MQGLRCGEQAATLNGGLMVIQWWFNGDLMMINGDLMVINGN